MKPKQILSAVFAPPESELYKKEGYWKQEMGEEDFTEFVKKHVSEALEKE